MIKGKPPVPFQTIALGISFSPGLPALISEMRRLREIHYSLAVFIHVGKKTSDKNRELSELLTFHGFNDFNSRIYWENGDEVTNILRICKHEVVDLLLIGASDKLNFAIPAGKITRILAVKAKCSVLIYTTMPASQGYNSIIVSSNDERKSELTLTTAIHLAETEKAKELIINDDIVRNIEADSNSLSLVEEPVINLTSLTETLNKLSIKVSRVSLNGYTELADYAFRNEVDLLVTNSSDHRLHIFDRISYEEGIETLIDKLPCNLLLVHSRIQN